MQGSNVDPEIYEFVTRKVLESLQNDTEEAVQQRSDCIQNILTYQEAFEAKGGITQKEQRESQQQEIKKKEQTQKSNSKSSQKNFSL